MQLQGQASLLNASDFAEISRKRPGLSAFPCGRGVKQASECAKRRLQGFKPGWQPHLRSRMDSVSRASRMGPDFAKSKVKLFEKVHTAQGVRPSASGVKWGDNHSFNPPIK